MNLKIILDLFGLISKFKQVNFDGITNVGWKSITGALLIGLGYAAKALSSIEPTLDQIGDGLIAIGAGLAGIGFRSAINKASKASGVSDNVSDLPPSERGETLDND